MQSRLETRVERSLYLSVLQLGTVEITNRVTFKSSNFYFLKSCVGNTYQCVRVHLETNAFSSMVLPTELSQKK